MPPAKPIEVLYCCSDSERDEEMRQNLEKHLKILQWQGFITTWHKGMIGAGKEWESETYTQLMTADIILLLISSEFFASDYNWNIVLERAKERHKARTARVIPVLLRRVDNWKVAFGNLKLKALPEREKPVTDWRPYDNAFESIAKGIRDLVEELTASPFSLKSYPQLRVGVTAVARTIASVSTVTTSLLPKKLKSRRRKKANLTTVIKPVVIVMGGIITINHLPHILRMPSLVPNLASNSIQNITPIGWIRLGVVDNNSGSLYAGERLIQSSSSNLKLASSIDYPVVPTIGKVVTVKNFVNLRKDRPKSYLPKMIASLKPGEKLVILKVEPLVIPPRKEVWAQVGRCNQACDR
jgi:hypothetical protein